MANASGAVDLGAPRKQEDFDDLTADQQEELRKMAQESHAAIDVLTAFTVFILPNGNTQIAQYKGDDFILATEPNNDLISGAVAVIAKDMLATETAQATIHLQMQQMQAIAQQQAAQQQLAGLGDIRGGQR